MLRKNQAIFLLDHFHRFKMEAISISMLIFLSCMAFSNGQCISANDIEVNETSVGQAVRTLIDGTTSFSLEMLRVLNSEQRFNYNSNGLFFSPLSIWSALMVTFMGARGATEQELRAVLGLGGVDKMTAWATYRNIRSWDVNSRNQQRSNTPGYRLANRIYFQEGTTFRDCVREFIEPEIGFLNFETQAEAARGAINSWVEQQTEQRIKDVIPPGSINALTRMVIANAVYFKESWLQEFNVSQTKRFRFIMPSRTEMFVDMMSIRDRFQYGVSEELQCTAIELPYAGNSMRMVILLPNNKLFGIDILINMLTPEKLRNVLNDMYPREVRVYIPKFHLEDSFELKTNLNRMGLRTLFDAGRVDLSGFTGQRDFAVDAVHHKSFIDVNEEGTEAAGATAILMSRTSRPLDPATFTADHAFLFLIQDNFSNVILFMGTVRKPTPATK